MAQPSKYYRNNVAQSLNIFDAMVETGVARLVISSSSAVYGMPAEIPVTEAAPIAPISTYGSSKAMLEEMARWYGMAHGMKTLALRYFNAAGADPDGDIGEYHRPESHLIPITVEVALGERRSMRINGTDYATPDGTAIRDYIHVSDLASAHAAALRFLEDGGEAQALNLGSGHGISIREIIQAVTAAAGRAPKVELGPRRAGDPPILVADPSKAFATLDWQIRHSDITQIAETAVRWHRDYLPTKISPSNPDKLIRGTG
jgi:UDP-glucose-4-epimerase GalE